MALCAFINIEDAFDNTPHTSLQLIVASLRKDTMKATTEKGCPQGGILWHLLRSLLVDDIPILFKIITS